MISDQHHFTAESSICEGYLEDLYIELINWIKLGGSLTYLLSQKRKV